MEFTFASLAFEPTSGAVQFLNEDTKIPAVSLRVCHIAGVPTFILGSSADPQFYSAEAIIRGLCLGKHEFGEPLPPRLLYPECLDQFNADEVDLILDAALSVPKSVLRARAGGLLEIESIISRAARAGFVIANSMAAGPIEIKVRAEIAKQTREARKAEQIAQDLHNEGNAVQTSEDGATQFFTVMKAAPQLVERIERQLKTTAENRPRISWKFNAMDVGDKMILPANLAKRGQTAVHVYAARAGRRFHTETQRGTGYLVVIRISDKATKSSID